MKGTPYLFLFAIALSFALTIDVSTQGDFNAGTYINVTYNTSEQGVHLNLSNTTGSYLSQIFDAGAVVNWTSISWTTCAYYGKQYPDGQGAESGRCGINMSGNVLLLHFNESAGATNFYDASGLNNNGTCSGATCPTAGVAGIFGAAADFVEAQGDFLVCGVNGMSNALPITLEAWVYFKSNQGGGDYDYVIRVTSWNGNELINLAREAINHRVYYVDDGTVKPGGVLPTGEWLHVALVFQNATSVKSYIDGLEVPITQPTLLAPGAPECRIATFTPLYPHYLDGILDEVAVYQRALSAQEIANRFIRGNAQYNISVRSCDDPLCAGEPWVQITAQSPQTLTLTPNRYFQFKIDFKRNKATNIHPVIYNVSINYQLQASTGGGGGGSPPKNMNLEINSTCNQTIIKVSDNNGVVDGVKVFVSDQYGFTLANNYTDQNGTLAFPSTCGQDIWIKASKSGYLPLSEVAQTIDCSQCVSPCPPGQQLINGSCQSPPPPDCGCGYFDADLQQCVAFQCCSDADCGDGFICSQNQCIEKPKEKKEEPPPQEEKQPPQQPAPQPPQQPAKEVKEEKIESREGKEEQKREEGLQWWLIATLLLLIVLLLLFALKRRKKKKED